MKEYGRQGHQDGVLGRAAPSPTACNKNRKAHFVLLNLDAPPAAVAEIERQERINEDVLRYLTVRVEELEEGPSAMMRKAERDRDACRPWRSRRPRRP